MTLGHFETTYPICFQNGPPAEMDYDYKLGNDTGGRYLFTIDAGDGKKRIRCSAKEYRHITHMNSYRNFLTKKGRKFKVQRELVPYSLKVSDYGEFCNNLKVVMSRMREMLFEYQNSQYRKRRLVSHRHKRSGFFAMARKIIGSLSSSKVDASKIIIGWGDGGGNQIGVKGHHMPLKEFRDFISKNTKIQSVSMTLGHFETTSLICSQNAPVQKYALELN